VGVLRWLLDSDSFVPRGDCGDWGPWLPWVYQGADLAIALSYFSIPAMLVWLWRGKKSVLPKPWVLLCFAAFIALCGLGHVIDGLSFWWPAYRLNTFERVLTALASVATAAALPSAVRHVSRLPSPNEYAETLRVRQLQAQVLEDLNLQLNKKYTHARAELDKARSLYEELRGRVVTEDRYQALRQNLHDVRDALLRRDPPAPPPP
jgi:two-component system sensor histidine kinase/response regulator